MSALPNLKAVFDEFNVRFFAGKLFTPRLIWNSKLKSTAGRFGRGTLVASPRIEIATFLLEGADSINVVRDTMGHEMIHY